MDKPACNYCKTPMEYGECDYCEGEGGEYDYPYLTDWAEWVDCWCCSGTGLDWRCPACESNEDGE